MKTEWIESIGKDTAPLAFLEIWKHYVNRKRRYAIMLMVKGQGFDVEMNMATIKLAKKRMAELVRSWKSDENAAIRGLVINAARRAF